MAAAVGGPSADWAGPKPGQASSSATRRRGRGVRHSPRVLPIRRRAADLGCACERPRPRGAPALLDLWTRRRSAAGQRETGSFPAAAWLRGYGSLSESSNKMCPQAVPDNSPCTPRPVHTHGGTRCRVVVVESRAQECVQHYPVAAGAAPPSLLQCQAWNGSYGWPRRWGEHEEKGAADSEQLVGASPSAPAAACTERLPAGWPGQQNFSSVGGGYQTRSPRDAMKSAYFLSSVLGPGPAPAAAAAAAAAPAPAGRRAAPPPALTALQRGEMVAGEGCGQRGMLGAY